MLDGPEAPSAAEMTAQLFLGSAGQRRRQELARARGRIAAPVGPPAFVAVDLLLVDDEPILDVPLLERKRILEGVLDEAELVRRTVFVRPPVDPWLGTWRSLGFGRAGLQGGQQPLPAGPGESRLGDRSRSPGADGARPAGGTVTGCPRPS